MKEQADLMLDGNAIAGLLGEIFAMEMTSAIGKCAGCGATNQIGRVHVYMNAPGAVVRCPDCTAVLMRIVHGRGRYWIDLSGLRVLEFAEG